MTSDDLDDLYKRFLKEAGSQKVKIKKPGLILSFDAHCHLLGVEPNKDNYNKWEETASFEAFENQNEA